MRVRDVDGVIPLAFACFLLAYIEGISAARTLAQKNGYEIDPRQELLALGAANLAAAFGQGYPVAGGLSQSSVNDKAGAKTPLALIFASAVIALCLLFLTGLLRNLPNVILAAIVLVAVAGLIKVADLRRLWRVRRAEFAIAMVALVGVLLLGILKGVIVAAVMSLAMLLRDMARPHVAVLGRIPGTRRYSDCERHPDNETGAGRPDRPGRGPASLLQREPRARRGAGSISASARGTGSGRRSSTSPPRLRRRDRGLDARLAAAGAGGGRRSCSASPTPTRRCATSFVPAVARRSSVS